MNERVTRSTITPPPPSERDALVHMGCAFEETEDGLVVTYPEGATRETINEREGRYAVFFIYHYEQRQVTELYNRTPSRMLCNGAEPKNRKPVQTWLEHLPVSAITQKSVWCLQSIGLPRPLSSS